MQVALAIGCYVVPQVAAKYNLSALEVLHGGESKYMRLLLRKQKEWKGRGNYQISSLGEFWKIGKSFVLQRCQMPSPSRVKELLDD